MGVARDLYSERSVLPLSIIFNNKIQLSTLHTIIQFRENSSSIVISKFLSLLNNLNSNSGSSILSGFELESELFLKRSE